MIAINIAKDFARYPFGRYRTDGPYSGQRFREEFLMPAFQKGQGDISVILDGAIGMGSSFLEEAFGGLVRFGLERSEVQGRLRLVSTNDESLATEIADYIAVAEAPRRSALA